MFYPTWGDKVFKEHHVIKLVKSTLGLFPCRCESHGRQRFRSIRASAPPLPWHHGCNPPHLGGGGISAGAVMDIKAALQEVLKTTLTQDGPAQGVSKLPKP